MAYQPGSRRGWDNLRVYVHGLAFEIKFSNHAAADRRYVANLRAFVAQSQSALPSVNALVFSSNPLTAEPSEPWTPNPRPIYHKEELIGKGEFGLVHKVTKARDGKQYASKTFFAPPKKISKRGKRKRDELEYDKWLESVRNEIAIMRNNPHVSCAIATSFEFGLA